MSHTDAYLPFLKPLHGQSLALESQEPVARPYGFFDSTLCIKVQFFLNSHSANILLLLGTLGTWDRNSFKLMGHFWWAIVVICAIVLIFARWAKKWVQNKTHHITITFSWLCDELIQATILLKWYLRSISQHLLFHPIVIKKWWKCDGPS